MGEKEALKSVDSMHVVRLHRTLATAESLVFVLEPCTAGRVDEVLGGIHGWDARLQFASRVILAAVLALRDLHRAGYLHCDLKPSNCLVSADGSFRLADLDRSMQWSPSPECGRAPFSTAVQSALPDGSVFVRGPAFAAAPEVATHGAYSPAADFWHVSAMLVVWGGGRATARSRARAAPGRWECFSFPSSPERPREGALGLVGQAIDTAMHRRCTPARGHHRPRRPMAECAPPQQPSPMSQPPWPPRWRGAPWPGLSPASHVPGRAGTAHRRWLPESAAARSPAEQARARLTLTGRGLRSRAFLLPSQRRRRAVQRTTRPGEMCASAKLPCSCEGGAGTAWVSTAWTS